MAKRSNAVRIRVRTSFNGMYAGDESDLDLTAKVQGWIDVGVVELVGQGAAGPGSVEPDDAGGKPSGVGSGVPAGRESGEGPSSG